MLCNASLLQRYYLSVANLGTIDAIIKKEPFFKWLLFAVSGSVLKVHKLEAVLCPSKSEEAELDSQLGNELARAIN